MSQLLPLPVGYFVDPKLSADAFSSIVKESSENVKRVFRSVQENSDVEWTSSSQRDGAYMYKGVSKYNPDEAYVRCVGVVDASIPELMEEMVTTDTKEFRRTCRLLHDNFVDGQVIANVVTPSEDLPYYSVNVKWMALTTPALMRNRDFCFIEHTNMYKEKDGSTIGFRVMESIELAQCPSMEDTHGLVRGRLERTGYIFRNKGQSETKILHMNSIDMKGSMFGFATSKMMLSFASVIPRLRRHFERRQIDGSCMIEKGRYVRLDSMSTCQRCDEMFGAFRMKHNCRSCGKVVCGQCSDYKSVDLPGAGIKKLRICHACKVHSVTRELRRKSSAGSYHGRRRSSAASMCSASDTISTSVDSAESNEQVVEEPPKPTAPIALLSPTIQKSLSKKSLTSITESSETARLQEKLSNLVVATQPTAA